MPSFKSLGLLLTCLTVLPLVGIHAAEPPEPIKAMQARGAKLLGSFDAPGGLKGYAAQYQGQGLTLYLTPDGKHVLVGSLFDAKGEDLSEAPLQKLVYEPQSKQMWSQLQGSTWIADGKDDAARIVYVFSDPNCPYCNLFWQQARPWVEAGKVQLRHVMVGIIKADSPGKAAALLTAKNPQAALQQHESAGRASTLQPLKHIPANAEQQLAGNLALMNELGSNATPAIFYLDAQGRLQQQQGAPRPEILAAVLGPRP